MKVVGAGWTDKEGHIRIMNELKPDCAIVIIEALEGKTPLETVVEVVRKLTIEEVKMNE